MDPERFHPLVAAGSAPGDEGDILDLRPELRRELGDRLVAVSPAVAGDLAARRIGSERVTVVPLGLDLRAFAARPALEGLPPPVVTTVARLVPVKDIPLFLDAMRIVRSEVPNVTAQVVG